MKRRRVLQGGLGVLVVLGALLGVAPPARAVLIDFESLGLNEVVTNQFAADGILFGNAVTLVAFVTLNEIDFPPASGVNVISGLGDAPLSVNLPSGAPHVSFQITTASVAQVQFLDSFDALLGQSLVDPNLGGHTLVAFDSPSPIATVLIASQAGGNALFLTVDDFEAVFAAPEPSILALMAWALLLVAAARVAPRHS